MLDIIINGQKITILRGTTIQVEINNNIFSTDGIEGDVAYSFDVPAAPNDLIFDSARFVYVQRRRKYDCTILLAGTPIGNGNLYVTKATKDTYSCEVTVNAFPYGWRDRKLRDNDYGDDIIISDSYDNHKQGWLDFLTKSLADDSVVKFPLFLDEDYYSDNEDFGMYDGHKNIPIGLSQHFQRDTKFVNRLAYMVDNNEKKVAEHLAFSNPGGSTQTITNRFEIFNKAIPIDDRRFERNQVSFAPAFSIDFLVKKVLENAKYNVSGNFCGSSELLSLFFQSLCSMDSTVKEEYTQHDGYVQCSLHESTVSVSTVTRDNLPLIINDSDEDENDLFDVGQHTYTISQDGVHHFAVTIRFCANTMYFTPGHAGCFIVREFPSNNLPQQINFFASDDEPATPDPNHGFTYAELLPFYYDIMEDDPNFLHFCKISGNSLSSYVNDGIPGVFEVRFDFIKEFTPSDIGKKLLFSFTIGQLSGFSSGYALINRQDLSCDIVMQIYAEDICMSNIFKKSLQWSEYMPNMTNSEFLNALIRLYGIAIYVDSSKRNIELSFIKDILSSLQIDLTNYTLPAEIQIEHHDMKNMKFELEAVTAASEDSVRLDDAEFMSELPPARLNIGKSSFVKHLNAVYQATRVEDSEIVWNNIWQRIGGNNSSLEVHVTDEDDLTEIKPNCKIPSIEFISSSAPFYARYFLNTTEGIQHTITDDERTITEKLHFLEISGQCKSYLNNNEGNESDVPLILIRYIGDEKLPPHTDYEENHQRYVRRAWSHETYIQRFSPVCYNNDNQRVPGNDLTATGEHSIGEVYVKPWLQLLSNYEKITYRFLLPPAKLLEVIRLFRPQNASPSQQVRWVFVENVRVLPIRMTFEIVEGKDQILTEIECAKPVLEN